MSHPLEAVAVILEAQGCRRISRHEALVIPLLTHGVLREAARVGLQQRGSHEAQVMQRRTL